MLHGLQGNQTKGYSNLQQPMTAAPEQPIGRLTENVQRTVHLTEQLSAELQQLASRIDPFLRPSPPNGGSGSSTPTALQSPFAGVIDQTNERMAAMVDLVQSLSARVDL
jgi:hypothetical protein